MSAALPNPCLDLATGRLDLHLMPVTTDCEDDRVTLSDAELARARRFRRAADRALFIQAHGLLRRVLSRHAEVAPAQWHFTTGPWGKPALCPRRHPTLRDLRFNLSHCAGHVAVVVAWAREVGVDIERIDALSQPGELVPSLLGPREQQDWLQTGSDLLAQQHFLMTRWTLKRSRAQGAGCRVDRGGAPPARDPARRRWPRLARASLRGAHPRPVAAARLVPSRLAARRARG